MNVYFLITTLHAVQIGSVKDVVDAYIFIKKHIYSIQITQEICKKQEFGGEKNEKLVTLQKTQNRSFALEGCVCLGIYLVNTNS